MNYELKNQIVNDPKGAILPIILGDNKKIGAIPSLNCETALNCSSDKMGFCKVCNVCYAKSDAKQYKSHYERTLRGCDLWELLKGSIIVFKKFCEVLEDIEPLAVRFNIVGDFTDTTDIELIKILAFENPKIKFYGYSKRKDLKRELEDLLKLPNVFLGVPVDFPHIKGANCFDVVDNISEWYFNHYKCLGSCETCQKCFNLKGEYITCFVHGSPSKIQKSINNIENWEFMGAITKQYLGVYPLGDFPSGFFCKKFNEFLEGEGYQVPFKLTKKGNKSYMLNTVPKLVNWIKERGAL